MADPVQPTQTVTQPSAANPATAAATNSQKTFSTGEAASSGDKVSSLAALKEQAPEVYHLMLVGIAQKICKDMEDGQQRLKEIMRKNRDSA